MTVGISKLLAIQGGDHLKHGKRPTKAQKIRIKSQGLNPDNWLVVTDHQGVFEILHRDSGKLRTIGGEKFGKVE